MKSLINIFKNIKEQSASYTDRGWVKQQQQENDSPLDGKTKTAVKSFLYKKFAHYTKKTYHDEAWTPVTEFFKELQNLNISYIIINTDYHKENGVPTGKTWKFYIEFINQNNRKDKLYGYLTAGGSGSVQDPLEKYDLTIVFS